MKRRKQSSSRNRRRVSNGERNMPSTDRLSGLPDAVLCHILSFLPTKLSVRTSILSSRWRFLWTDVPILDFNFDDYNSYSVPSFSEIVDKVMLLHSVQNLNTFRLSSCEFDCIDCDEHQLETWITAAIARRIRTLDICLGCQVMLPRVFFTCKTVVDLSLNRVEILLTDTVCFPCLKKLSLVFVLYKTDETLPHLISGCPVLEELLIDTYSREDLVCCRISSSTIKSVNVCLEAQLRETLNDDDIFENHDHIFEINAPALRYLRLSDSISKHISAHTLTSLIEAYICLGYFPDEDIVAYSDYLLQFVNKLCNVKCLTLSSSCLEFIEPAFSASTLRFRNLIKLKLFAEWCFITKFLEKADNHQVLIIDLVYVSKRYWMEPQQVPSCLSSRLTTIKICSFGYAEHEFTVVRYLLMNAQVLRTMEICSRSGISDYKKKFYGLKRISMFQRASATCELDFH